MNNTELLDTATKKTFGQRLMTAWRDITKNQYAYLSVSFLIPALIMLVIYLFRGLYPIGNGCVLVLDLNGQYVYFYEALREFIYGDTSLLYSFSRALGGEFLGIYAYYIASPLSWLVALFPEGAMLEALLVIFLLKTGLCGFTFGWYLHKTSRHVNRFYVWTFSTMYALCSYAVTYQHNSMWIDAMIWLPVLTYAIEQMIHYGKYKLFVISLAMTVMSNFYIGYMVCIYVALYFFYYYAVHGGKNPSGEKHHFLRSLARIGLFSLLAIGISAVVILGAYYSLGFGKSTFSTPKWDFSLRFDLSDLFVKLLPGAYDTVQPAGLPILYCGILPLLLIPFFYLRKDISVKEKLLSTLFVAVFVASFIISPLDIVWHGFQKPNWLNYRYSFLLCFFLLLMAYKGLAALRRIKGPVLLCCGSLLILAVTILQKFEYENFTLDKYGLEKGKIDSLRTVWFTILAVIALCSVLAMIIRAKRPRDVRKYAAVLLAVVCVESFANGSIQLSSLDIDVSFSTYSSYNSFLDGLRPIVDEVQEMDTSFYRMEKVRMRKTNDDMALNMRGLSCSTSTLNQETILFLQSLGYTSYSNRSKYMGQTPISDSLLGVKYILSEKDVSESRADYNENRTLDAMMSEFCPVYTEEGGYVAYLNPFALSIAYTVSSDIKNFSLFTFDEEGEEEMLAASPMERLNALTSALIGSSSPVFYPIETADPTYDNCRKSYGSTYTKYSEIDSSKPATISFHATAPADAYVFFYAPSDHPRDTKLTVNGTNFGDFMTSDSNRIKAIGKFSEGDDITVSLTLKETAFYLTNDEYVLYFFDAAQFEAVIDTLSQEQFIIEEYTETCLSGTISTSDGNETVLTTIPYDEGWEVLVDGQPVEIFKATNALIAFDIDQAGEHTLVLRYAPKIIYLGVGISLVSLVLFGAVVTVDIRAKRKQKKDTPSTH